MNEPPDHPMTAVTYEKHGANHANQSCQQNGKWFPSSGMTNGDAEIGAQEWGQQN